MAEQYARIVDDDATQGLNVRAPELALNFAPVLLKSTGRVFNIVQPFSVCLLSVQMLLII